MSQQPGNWEKALLGDIASVDWGNTSITKKSYIDSGVPAFSAAGQDGFVSTAERFGCGTVLSAIGAKCGKCFYAQGEWAAIKNTMVIQSNEQFVLNKYLFYYLNDEKRWPVSGSGQPFITQGDARKVVVPIAPLAEQKRIADKLDAVLARVDACRDRLDRIPTILKRFRQSVLAAAYQGKLTREFRLSNKLTPVSTMLAGIEPIPRPNRYNSRTETVIPGDYALSVCEPKFQSPAGWEWVPLVDVARMESGHTPSRSFPEYWDGDVPWIGIADARENHTKTIDKTLQHTNELGLANSAARLLPTDTVCVSRTASVGYVVKMGKPMATSQDFVNWICSPAIDSDWLKWLFVAEAEALPRFGKGTTHTTIYFPEWLSMHVALPSIEEQKEIVRRIETLLSFADRLETRVTAARESADRLTPALLAKAFRGELVAQDPNDEPAAELLKRFGASNNGEDKPKRGRKRV